ncbi:MAG: metal ABC transporter permease [Bacillota bacterium]
MLAYAFIQRALLAGTMVGILCSVVAVFVVLKKMSFAAMGLSHAAFGGVALGLFFRIDPVLTGGAFATLVSWVIAFVSRNGKVEEDTSIGIMFSAAMAAGIVIAGFTKGYYADVFSYFFGNILAVSRQDLIVLGALGGSVLITLTLLHRPLLFICFDEDAAEASGLPVALIYYTLFTAVAITVVLTVKIVGVVLASALLVIPAATGLELCTNYRTVVLVSVLSGVVSSMGGLALSYILDIPSGASIVLVATALFALAFSFSPKRVPLIWLRGALRRPRKNAAGNSKEA